VVPDNEAVMLLAVLFAGTTLSPPQSAHELVAEGARLAREQQWAEAERVLRQACERAPESPAPHVELGRVFLASGRPKEAIGALDEALLRSRGLFDALFLRGLALMQMERFAEASFELAAALDQRPEDAPCRRALGESSARAGDFERVVDALEPLVRDGKGDALVYALFGGALAELGRHQESLAPLEKAVALSPQDPTALFHLARSLFALGRYADAAARFEAGIGFPPPRNVRFEVGLAECSLRLGRKSDARARLADLLARHPRAARAWFLRGLLEAEDQKYPEATSSFRNAIEHGYPEAEAQLNLGMALVAAGERNAAREAFRRTLQIDPRRAGALYYLGVLALEDRNPEDAVRHLERAAAIERSEPRTFLALAEGYTKLGRYEEGLQAAAKATASPELAPRAHYAMGLAHHERLDYEQAEASYRKAVELGLDSAESRLNQGRALYGMAKHDEARAALLGALEREPDLAAAHLQLGKVLTELRDYRAAAEHLARARDLAPDNAQAWYQTGVVAQRRGEPGEAVASLREALRLDPDLLDAYYRLGTELAKQGQTDEGQKLLEAFRERSQAAEKAAHQNLKLSTTLRRALDLAAQGRDREALGFFDQARELGPGHPEPYLSQARFLRELGRSDEAVAVLREAIARIPDHLGLHELLLSVLETNRNAAEAELARKTIEALRQKSPR
jgi:tetratricopeptide (TPR) repeat protein